MATVINAIEVGARIKQARKEKGLSQREMSIICGCSITHISNIEAGKTGVSLSNMFKLCVLLEKSMEYLIKGEPKDIALTEETKYIKAKLEKCDSEMLNFIESIIDSLIAYRETIDGNKRITQMEASK